jgi:hypothetical protein
MVPELELEKHSKFCALGHEYRVKLSVLDKKLKKYAIIIASRRKLIKEVCFPLLLKMNGDSLKRIIIGTSRTPRMAGHSKDL